VKCALDGIALKRIRHDTYIGRIGYVPQEPFMINASIKENVTFRNLSEEDIVKLVSYKMSMNGSSLSHAR